MFPNYHALALTAIRAYREFNEALRPIDRKTKKAEFDGICRAVHALRLRNVPTPFALHLAIQDAVEAAGIRPSYRPVNNSAQQQYDEEVAQRLVHDLRWDV